MNICSLSNLKNETMFEFINHIRLLPFEKSVKGYVFQLLDFWEKYISLNKESFLFVKKEKQQVYPLVYFMGNDTVTIHFYINQIQKLIRNKEINVSHLPLYEIKNDLAFVETGSKTLDSNAFNTPLIAVILPSTHNGNPKSFFLIDGNHRLSAALYNKNEFVTITCIDEVVINKFAFTSYTNWLLYNIVFGVNAITSKMVDPKSYLDLIHTLLLL